MNCTSFRCSAHPLRSELSTSFPLRSPSLTSTTRIPSQLSSQVLVEQIPVSFPTGPQTLPRIPGSMSAAPVPPPPPSPIVYGGMPEPHAYQGEDGRLRSNSVDAYVFFPFLTQVSRVLIHIREVCDGFLQPQHTMDHIPRRILLPIQQIRRTSQSTCELDDTWVVAIANEWRVRSSPGFRGHTPWIL